MSLTFSPFVADLHYQGRHDRLDELYKQVTRWTLAATIPVLLVLLVMPGEVLRIFGDGFVEGETALRGSRGRDDRAGHGRHRRVHPDHGGPVRADLLV